jgi:hypothetical protein
MLTQFISEEKPVKPFELGTKSVLLHESESLERKVFSVRTSDSSELNNKEVGLHSYTLVVLIAVFFFIN